MGAKLKLSGVKFGRLEVVAEIKNRSREGKVVWLCKCDCGRQVEIRGSCLITGHTKSCGCYQGDVVREVQTTHGVRVRGKITTEYTSWSQMITRCINTKGRKYKYYGGRGIKVCDRWRFSFDNFLADMGPKPSPTHTLDRYPDMNGNYEPSNCRWATKKEQADNRRSTIWIEYNGERLTVADWSRKLGVNDHTFRDYIAYGKTPIEALMFYIKKKTNASD